MRLVSEKVEFKNFWYAGSIIRMHFERFVLLFLTSISLVSMVTLTVYPQYTFGEARPDLGPTIYDFVDEHGTAHIVDSRKFNIESNYHLQRTLDKIRASNTKIWSPEEIRAKMQSLTRFQGEKSAQPPPDSVDWSKYQTPSRNQLDRNTCSIFAMTAAIEARYRRQFDLTLDLSEQYFWHVYKSSGVSYPRKYLYENQSSYWGGGGSWGIEAVKPYTIPIETEAPYLNQHKMNSVRLAIPEAGALIWTDDPATNTNTQQQVDAFEYSTLYIPLQARFNARYGVKETMLLDGITVQNTTRMEEILAAGNDVMVDVNLKWRLNPETEIYEYDSTVAGNWHVFLIIGYNRPDGYFLVKNSWGEANFIKVSYEFIRKNASAGAIVTEVTDPAKPNPKGLMMGVWNMDHDGWKGQLIVRRVTSPDNVATRFGHYIDGSGNRQVVNGYFVDSNRGMKFAIGDTDENPVGEMTGQVFENDIYSGDYNYAAGFTTWASVPFGSFLTRYMLPGVSSNNFTKDKWIGTWDVNYDGRRGYLTIFGFSWFNAWRLNAIYVAENGQVFTVSGQLMNKREHIASFNIPFSVDNNQLFVLHFHTWENNMASGYTYRDGNRFGAHMVKEPPIYVWIIPSIGYLIK